MSEDQRRRQLIAAAGDVFLRKGYHATTMADIARFAGMSKRTVYQIFAAKTGLFDALLTDWFAPFTVPVETGGRPAGDVLTDLLNRVVTFALSDRQISMTRLLIAEASLSEDIAKALDRQGLGRGKGALEQFLAAQAALGTFRIADPADAAALLFHSAAGDFVFGLLLRTRPAPSEADVAARVKRAVAVFLRDADPAYAARG
jgi:AcrR family transcriptional regulator